MGTIGLRPDDYYWSFPADLSLIADGYRERLRVQWHQFALIAKVFGADVDVDSMFETTPKKTKINSREDFQEFLSRFPSHRKEQHGRPADSQS